jgi:sialic acid synthase SpsE
MFSGLNISVKRPAPKKNEIPAKFFFEILGKTSKKNIYINKKIKWSEMK